MKRNKIKQLSKKIVSTLKEASKNVEWKIGVEVEVVPKPQIRFFAHIYKLQKMLNKRVKQDGDSTRDNQSIQDGDESSIERESN